MYHLKQLYGIMGMKLLRGTDFRMQEYRREVFLRFYEFHLRYRSHAGAVYYVMPYLTLWEVGSMTPSVTRI